MPFVDELGAKTHPAKRLMGWFLSLWPDFSKCPGAPGAAVLKPLGLNVLPLIVFPAT